MVVRRSLRRRLRGALLGVGGKEYALIICINETSLTGRACSALELKSCWKSLLVLSLIFSGKNYFFELF